MSKNESIEDFVQMCQEMAWVEWLIYLGILGFSFLLFVFGWYSIWLIWFT